MSQPHNHVADRSPNPLHTLIRSCGYTRPFHLPCRTPTSPRRRLSRHAEIFPVRGLCCPSRSLLYLFLRKRIITIISCSIWPFLGAVPVTLVSDPLAVIDCTWFEGVRWFEWARVLVRGLELVVAGEHNGLLSWWRLLILLLSTAFNINILSCLSSPSHGLHFRCRLI